eukprot:s620_g5.t2
MVQPVPSWVVEDEQAKWAADHSLRINQVVRAQQVDSLQSFGDILYLCSTWRSQNGLEFHHYFVTDWVWTMDFLSTGLQVHQNTPPQQCAVHARFSKTNAVERRLRQVCGATAYSVALRNCEHSARYIHSGRWISYQMSGESSSLGATFVRSMMDEHFRKLNRLPRELREYARPTLPYSPNVYPGFLEYQGSPQGLSKADHSAFNVLVVGPSGCGKSRLINLLFNRKVAESRGSAASITGELHVYSGRGLINGRQKKVNIIDTIGLCDAHIHDEDFMQLTRNLKGMFAFLDQASANQMLSLLEVNATNMLAAGTPRNGDRVRFPLGARMPQMFAMPPPIPKCIMTAFPQAEFEVLRSDLAMAVDSIFAAPNEGQRIPTQTHSRKQSKWCGQAHVAMASRSGVVACQDAVNDYAGGRW